jgi:phosphatidylglycerophosphate synthase
MRILIDATTANANTRIFGMSLVERLLHSLRRSTLDPDEVRVEVHGQDLVVDSSHPSRRVVDRRDLGKLHVTWHGGSVPIGERISTAIEAAPDADWLILSGETIIDARLLPQIVAIVGNVYFASGEGSQRGALLKLEAGTRISDPSSESVLDLAERMASRDSARAMERDEFDGYIVNLRRDLDPYLFRVADEDDRRQVERFMFWSNYKGSTDFMTKYVWPPLVWLLVRPLARLGVHPNSVTAVSIIATILAIPLWMEGWWAAGFFCAYLMSLLDSVDGKLARLTFTYSDLGNVLDHGLDLIHPPFWYLAWGFGVSGGLDTATAVVVIGYLVGRLLEGLFLLSFEMETHCWRPIDSLFRTITARRNPNMILLTVGTLAGAPDLGMLMVAIWTVVSIGFHVVRLIQAFVARARGEVITAWDEAGATGPHPTGDADAEPGSAG